MFPIGRKIKNPILTIKAVHKTVKEYKCAFCGVVIPKAAPCLTVTVVIPDLRVRTGRYCNKNCFKLCIAKFGEDRAGRQLDNRGRIFIGFVNRYYQLVPFWVDFDINTTSRNERRYFLEYGNTSVRPDVREFIYDFGYAAIPLWERKKKNEPADRERGRAGST